MNLKEDVRIMLDHHGKLVQLVAEELQEPLIQASQLLAVCLMAGGKILSCGNGGSASDSLHFTAELANRFLQERDGLAAISLSANGTLMTAIANDYGYSDLFARQIKALGNKNDLLVAISTSGKSENIIRAVQQAHGCGMRVIGLTGNQGGEMREVLSMDDVELCIPSASTPRIQEMHILLIHCLCDLVDKILLTRGHLC